MVDRLEIPSYVLMLDYKELPKERYQELKYFLHHPDYGDKELQEQKEEYFDEPWVFLWWFATMRKYRWIVFKP